MRFLLISVLAAAAVLVAVAQDAAQNQPAMERAWDALLPQAIPSPQSQETLAHPPAANPNPEGDFLDHFSLESRTDYWRYSSSFTGLPTITGVISAPFTGASIPTASPIRQCSSPPRTACTVSLMAERMAGYRTGW